MPKRVLIVGAGGHIGGAVVDDLATHTDATLILAGRTPAPLTARAEALGARGNVRVLDLDSATPTDLQHAVRDVDLAIQCVGPFRTRLPALLLACIAEGVDYVDVCDDRRATEWRLGLHEAARAAGVTALIDTGTFPGIDNVLAAQLLAQHPDANELHLRFYCAGSGGGGFGVLQTTFLAVSRPYEELHNGRWVQVPSYRGGEQINFGHPVGMRMAYPFEVPEIWSLALSFPQLRTVTSRFGTSPALWNLATQALAMAPQPLLDNTEWLDLAAEFTIPWVQRVDSLVGHEVAVQVVVGRCNGQSSRPLATGTFYAASTTEAVGWATGAAVQMVLDGTVSEPGVLLPETHLPPARYLAALVARGGKLTHTVVHSRPSASASPARSFRTAHLNRPHPLTKE